jgi:hypothetical protein
LIALLLDKDTVGESGEVGRAIGGGDRGIGTVAIKPNAPSDRDNCSVDRTALRKPNAVFDGDDNSAGGVIFNELVNRSNIRGGDKGKSFCTLIKLNAGRDGTLLDDDAAAKAARSLPFDTELVVTRSATDRVCCVPER